MSFIAAEKSLSRPTDASITDRVRKKRLRRVTSGTNTTRNTAINTAVPSIAESLSPIIIAIMPSPDVSRYTALRQSVSVSTAITTLAGSVTQMKLASMFLLPIVEKNSMYTPGCEVLNCSSIFIGSR